MWAVLSKGEGGGHNIAVQFLANCFRLFMVCTQGCDDDGCSPAVFCFTCLPLAGGEGGLGHSNACFLEQVRERANSIDKPGMYISGELGG